MSLCKFCGNYTDAFEWPEEYREYAKPQLCFNCFKEDPSRGQLLPEFTPTIKKEEVLTIREEQDQDSDSVESDDVSSDTEDGREEFFLDADDGCATEDDNEDNPDDY